MSTINNLFGSASQIAGQEVLPLIADFVVEGEQILIAYKLWRDMIIFTTERLILVDVQGLTGSKVSFESIPYSTIKRFKMENAGTLDMDCEITLTLQGGAIYPLKFGRGTNLKPIYKYLSTYILRDN
ncbi:MAG: PH domain-containing protein [Candidatus Parcubacteria bacterium]|nr:PH domain-containing protein [Candidatus Paceibacterota bacterium]